MLNDWTISLYAIYFICLNLCFEATDIRGKYSYSETGFVDTLKSEIMRTIEDSLDELSEELSSIDIVIRYSLPRSRWECGLEKMTRILISSSDR